MKIALILPYSFSSCRIKNMPDVIHNSMLLEIDTFLQSNMIETRIFDYLGTENMYHTKSCNEIKEYGPDFIIIQPLHTIDDLKLYQEILNQYSSIAVGSVCCDVDFTKRYVKYVFPINPETHIADLLGIKIDSDRYLDDIMRSFDIQKLKSSISPDLAYITTSRGCAYCGCSFCIIGASCLTGKNYTFVDPEIICFILKRLQNSGIKYVQFMDSDFPGNDIRRLKKYCRCIKKYEISLQLHCDVRLSSLTDENTICMLKSIGVKSIFFGIDGSSNDMLKRINKNINFDLIENSIKLLLKQRLYFKFGWIVADSDTTILELKKACNFIISTGLYKMFEPNNLDDPTGLGTFFHEMHINAGTREYKKQKNTFVSELSPSYKPDVEQAFVKMWTMRKKLVSSYRNEMNKIENKAEKYNLKFKYNLASITEFYKILNEVDINE